MDKTSSAVTHADALAGSSRIGAAASPQSLAWLGTRKPQAALTNRRLSAFKRVRTQLNNNLGDISRGINRYCDLMGITRALHRMNRADK
jgi:hypothetical protein